MGVGYRVDRAKCLTGDIMCAHGHSDSCVKCFFFEMPGQAGGQTDQDLKQMAVALSCNSFVYTCCIGSSNMPAIIGEEFQKQL